MLRKNNPIAYVMREDLVERKTYHNQPKRSRNIFEKIRSYGEEERDNPVTTGVVDALRKNNTRAFCYDIISL